MTYRAHCEEHRRRRRKTRRSKETFPPKREWPPGPWHDEPDRLRFVTSAGLPGRMERAIVSGSWNGYVGVPFRHPCWGARLDDTLAPDVAAHGGLTHAGRAWWAPGDKHWWFGFDTSHAFDVMPAMIGRSPRLLMRGTKYRDVAYVRQEVEFLAQQLEILMFTTAKPPEGPPS